jgi:hypothetical protein
VAIATSVVLTMARNTADTPESGKQKVVEDALSLEALRAAGF